MADEIKTKVQFELDSKKAEDSSKRLKGSFGKLKDATDGVGKRLKSLTGSFSKFSLGMLGVGVGAGLLTRNIVGSNIELDNMQRRLTGTLFAFRRWKEGIDVTKAVTVTMQDAARVEAKLEGITQKLAVETGQLVGAYESVLGPLTKMGRSEDQVLEVTEGLASASKLFGISAEFAGKKISQVLLGQMPSVEDKFGQWLRITLSNVGDLKKMKPDQILDIVRGKLRDLNVASGMATRTFGDAVFRLKTLIGDTLRDIARPTFLMIGDAIQRLKDYLDKSTDSGKKLVDLVAGRMKRGFEVVGKVSKFLLEHWKQIALVIGGVKVAGLASGIAAAGAASGTLFGNLQKFVGKLGGATAALAAFYGAAKIAADFLVEHFAAKKARQAGLAGVETAAQALSRRDIGGARAFRQIMQQAAPGTIDANAVLRAEVLGKNVEQMSKAQQASLAKVLGVKERSRFIGGGYGGYAQERYYATKDIVDAIKTHWDAVSKMRLFKERVMPKDAGVPSLSELTTPGKDKVIAKFTGPVNINQKFEEADPDNVWLQIKKGIESTAESVVTAHNQEIFGPT